MVKILIDFHLCTTVQVSPHDGALFPSSTNSKIKITEEKERQKKHDHYLLRLDAGHKTGSKVQSCLTMT